MSFEALERRRLFAAGLLIDALGFSAADSVTVGTTTYFFADNGAGQGRELWKSDGTAAGTKLVKDLTPGAAGTELYAFFHAGDGRAVFLTVVHQPEVHQHVSDDYTLWASDGTAGGTVKLKEFKGTIQLQAKQLGDRVVVLQNTESTTVPVEPGATAVDAHLFVTDGTAAGTKEIKSFLATPGSDGVPPHNYMATGGFFDAGGRLVFGIGDFEHLWATDGTAAGTVDVSTQSLIDAINHFQANLEHMVQLDGGKVLIPSAINAGTFWVTDGTVGGTREIRTDFQGTILPFGDPNTVVDGKYIFVEQYNPGDSDHILPLVKIVHSLDIATGELTTLYTTTGDGSLHGIELRRAGSRILFLDVDRGDYTSTLWTTDGTAAGTVKLATYSNYTLLYDFTNVGGTSFFVLAQGPFVAGVAPADAQAWGYIGSGPSLREVPLPGQSELQLWRTDGTAANTGMVKTIWKGEADGLVVSAVLSEADGKLVMRTEVHSGVDRVHYPSDPSAYPTVFDDTSAYDDRELTFGRQGASARLVNGVLQVRGSYNDDRIRLWRSQRMPDRLVVEYNGNERSFPFSSIARITVDLQDGNDYFQILEGEGQVIRTRTSVVGGDGSDTIFGGTGRDTIYGGNSGDLIYGRGNADVILAGGGRDRVDGGVGDDQIAGGSGVDKITGGNGVDVLFGQSAVERAFGQDVEGDDRLDDVLLA